MTEENQKKAFWQADLVYTLVLFIVACSCVAWFVSERGLLPGIYDWKTASFFVVFGLFAISTGFPHPDFGHVSFDRVAQVASILILGPVDAAWINGLASFIYPWHRLAKGVPGRTVLVAALNNSGLMTLVVLLGGLLFEMLGGAIPLEVIDLRSAGLLLVLMLTMQFLNDLGMMAIIYMLKLDPRSLFNAFTTAVESISVVVAVVVAIAFTTMSGIYFALLLVVLGIGMLVIRQYAFMRQRLESLVEARTEELRIQAIEFEHQATHDKLTGLPNRRYVDDFVERELELARRSGEKMTVALADVDLFKQINDTFSHAVGDEVLRRVAHLMSDRCRKSDIVARYGGEEFLLCFPNTDVEFAVQICNQIRLAVQNTRWSRIESDAGQALSVTISFGIAESYDESRMTTLLRDADTRLYRAKRSGRNLVIAE